MTIHTHDGQLIEPDVAMLTPSPTNPRRTFDAEALRGLADSIADHGIMQPIVVRELSDDTRRQLGTEARLEIIAGERRWLAAQLAGLQTVPCILRNPPDDAVERLQIIENLQREGLSPIEEAEGFGRLAAQGLSAEQIAATVGKSKAYVYAKLKLRALCDDVARALHQGKLSESVALQIARIPVPDLQRDALAAVTQPDEYTGEVMSFRRAKAHILQSYTRNLAKAAFDPPTSPCAPRPAPARPARTASATRPTPNPPMQTSAPGLRATTAKPPSTTSAPSAQTPTPPALRSSSPTRRAWRPTQTTTTPAIASSTASTTPIPKTARTVNGSRPTARACLITCTSAPAPATPICSQKNLT